MNRVTVEVSNSRDVHISVPNWLFKLIGFLMVLRVIFWSVAILMSGYPVIAIVLFFAGLVSIPVSLLLTYMYWRFFWWLNAALLLCSTGFWLPTMTMALLQGWKPSDLTRTGTLPGAFSSGIPVENLLIGGVAVLVIMLIALFVRRRSSSPRSGSVASSQDFEFVEETPTTFQDRVAQRVSGKGRYQTTIEMDNIRVYSGKKLVGVVKCIDKPGKPVSPIMVKEARRLADSNSV